MSYLYFCNGDWTVSKDGTQVVCGDVIIADVHGSNNADYPEETQGANARLIAGAPVMYRILETLIYIHSSNLPEAKKDEIIGKHLAAFRELRKNVECEVVTRHLGNIRRLEEQQQKGERNECPTNDSEA